MQHALQALDLLLNAVGNLQHVSLFNTQIVLLFNTPDCPSEIQWHVAS